MDVLVSDVWRVVASRRYALLAGTAFSQGASLGPLIGAAMAMDSALVIHYSTCPFSLRPTALRPCQQDDITYHCSGDVVRIGSSLINFHYCAAGIDRIPGHSSSVWQLLAGCAHVPPPQVSPNLPMCSRSAVQRIAILLS